ncbi:MAG TPA: protein-L-isoaspartate(D-aspartate) O-methyltransferase [Bacteroidia bacterium]|jgi:protein-L-isoaspartate(D-aspartate) O-methyltransferase|nr:protein-L-isoaspartate(D-aspartate) O-methyltransferase [Bacteroidia bacterium]
MSNDTYRHKGLRRQLALLLKEKGIENAEVLKAIEAVPRHLFLNSSFIERAYEDIAFPIGSGQTISRPHTVAFQTELLELKRGEKVLEIGTGSGYQTCVLMEMGVKVFTIERQKALFDSTKIFLPSLGYGPKFFYGDGYKGLPVFAPFDKIIITAGAPSVPQALLDQLKTGGRMVIPLGDKVQIMTLICKIDDKKFEKTEFGEFKFVPLLEHKEWGD